MLRKEFKIFLTAILYYTRIPISRKIKYSSDNLNKATRYLPFIGYWVATVGALVYLVMQMYLNTNISIIGSMVAMVLFTGAFHEDAIADFCDGFGGGYTREKILSIMKDSRIGTYGAVGLCLLFLSKYVLLQDISVSLFPKVLIAAQVLSRVILVILIYTSQYVGNIEVSKAKAVGGKKSLSTLVVSMLWLVPLFFLIEIKAFLFIIPIQLILLVYFRYYIHKKIGGYTGDVLGALQQLSEVFFYVSFLIFAAIQ